MMKFSGLSLLAFIFALAWSCTNQSSHLQDKGYTIIESTRLVEDSSYSISLNYPVFNETSSDTNGLESFNEAIQSFLDTAARYYWGVEADSIHRYRDERASSGKYILDNQYQILDTTRRLISILMETYSFALGAHGFSALHTFNWDVEGKKFLTLRDVLNLSTEDDAKLLNQLLIKYFEDPDNCFNDSPRADADFELFGLKPGFLVFYYETYELGPHYCGSAKVHIPVETLVETGLWKTDFP
jgi:hypothetical protein